MRQLSLILCVFSMCASIALAGGGPMTPSLTLGDPQVDHSLPNVERAFSFDFGRYQVTLMTAYSTKSNNYENFAQATFNYYTITIPSPSLHGQIRTATQSWGDGLLYAVTTDGLFASRNGFTWKQDRSAPSLLDLTVSSDGTLIGAAGKNGLWLKEPNGQWQKAYLPQFASIDRLAISPITDRINIVAVPTGQTQVSNFRLTVAGPIDQPGGWFIEPLSAQYADYEFSLYSAGVVHRRAGNQLQVSPLDGEYWWAENYKSQSYISDMAATPYGLVVINGDGLLTVIDDETGRQMSVNLMSSLYLTGTGLTCWSITASRDSIIAVIQLQVGNTYTKYVIDIPIFYDDGGMG